MTLVKPKISIGKPVPTILIAQFKIMLPRSNPPENLLDGNCFLSEVLHEPKSQMKITYESSKANVSEAKILYPLDDLHSM